MRLGSALEDAVLERWPVARLATVSAAGAPHLVPVVFARGDALLYTPVDDKPKRGRGELARVANVRARPEVALLLDHYAADWRALWWLRVDGQARILAAEQGDELAPATRALERKYPQYGEIPVLRRGGAGVVLAIEPKRVASWCASEAARRALEAQLAAGGGTSSSSDASPGTPTRSGKP